MRILLVYPRWGQVDRFPGRPPIGLGYLASYLREHESIIFDQQVDPRPLDSVIMDSAPNVVGFSVSTWTFRQVLDTIKVLKGEYRSIIWVAGGPHPTAMPEQMLKGGVDIVVRGYGEETMAEVVSALEDRKPLCSIAGISYTDHGTFCHNPDRHPSKSLDELPYPSYALYDLGRYQWCSVTSSRGCPVGCIFCVDSYLFARETSFRSPENFVRELEFLNRELGLCNFYFVDEQFTFDNERAIRICELIQQKRLNIRWLVNSRVDRVSVDLVEKMKQAGCISVAFGVESGSEQILRTIRKHITIEQVIEAIRKCKQVGVRVKTSWIVGLPGPMKEQLKSIDLMEITEPNHIDAYLLTIYPGTPLWHHADKFGIYIDKENPPVTLLEKLESDRYRLDYLSKEQIVEIAQRMTEAMLRRGYRIARWGEDDYDPQSKVIATYLRYVAEDGLPNEFAK